MSVPLTITFTNTPEKKTDVLVVGCYDKQEFTDEAKALDHATQGLLTQSLNKNRFKGTLGQGLTVYTPRNGKITRVLVVGLGAQKSLTLSNCQALGGHIFAFLSQTKEAIAEINLGSVLSSSLSLPEIYAHIGMGAQLRAWRFEKYKVAKKPVPEEAVTFKNMVFLTSSASFAQESQTLYSQCLATLEGIFLTRELVTEPANILFPEEMANRLKNLEKQGLEIEILTKKELEKLGMGSLLCVAQGSAKEPRVVILQWKGGKAQDAPLAFTGKGVTFDTGGISLKPAAGMWDMKYDMAGAAAVAGVMVALAGRKAKVNAVGVVGLVENMPSGTATRPGDVVTSFSGQTIEVLNTDAEGRLVLADVLWYTQDRFKPKFMIDLATLTGAVVVSLGSEYAGLFSNNEELVEQLMAAGQSVAEKVWRLPLGDAFDKMIDSDIADLKNITTGGDARKAGSSTAGQFLQRFVNQVPWAHLDIAGMAWAERPLAICERGATGFGVQLLDRFVQEYYEK